MKPKITDVQSEILMCSFAGLDYFSILCQLKKKFPYVTVGQIEQAWGGLDEESKLRKQDDEETSQLGRLVSEITDKAELLSDGGDMTLEESMTFLRDHGDQEARGLLEEWKKHFDP